MSDFFYNPIKRDITIVKGDTCSFGIQIQGLEGQTPDGVILTCKQYIEDNTPLFEISLNDTIVLRSYDEDIDVLTYAVRIPPEKTEELDLGRYFYDLEVRVNGDVFTLLKGRLTLDYEVTSDYTPTPPTPAYEDGDNIAYPLVGIPEGSKKVYTEQFISNIAEIILNMTGSTEPLTVEQMSEAISQIVRGFNTRKIQITRTNYEEVQ